MAARRFTGFDLASFSSAARRCACGLIALAPAAPACGVGIWVWDFPVLGDGPRLLLYVEGVDPDLQLPHLNRRFFAGAIRVAVSVLRSALRSVSESRFPQRLRLLLQEGFSTGFELPDLGGCQLHVENFSHPHRKEENSSFLAAVQGAASSP